MSYRYFTLLRLPQARVQVFVCPLGARLVWLDTPSPYPTHQNLSVGESQLCW